VCNPPFFSATTPNACNRLARARHNDALPLPDLLAAVDRLLSSDGRAWLLLPLPQAAQLLATLTRVNLHARVILEVRSRAQDSPHRQILQLERRPGPCRSLSLALYTEHPLHSPEAAQLFEPYYLKLRRA
jgi:tRNA1Val (adenine37-N6)-methyltransferase